MKPVVLAVAVVLSAANAATAQTSEQFEVTSVKPSTVAATPNLVVDPGRFTATGVALADLIRYAYGFNSLASQPQVTGGPSWITTTRFDIVATSKGQPGGTLPPTSSSANTHCGIQGRPGSYRGNGTSMSQLARALGNFPAIGRVVVDRTGVTGVFDWTLEWTPSFNTGPTANSPPVANPDATAGVSLFTALREQLGLKLEAQRMPIDVLVVDRAELPAPD
jgi:uncharacterized protein DUF3738